MSTTLERTLYDALAKYLMTKVTDCFQVTGFNTTAMDQSSGCDCCGSWMEYETDVWYVTPNGKAQFWTYFGSFDDLFAELVAQK